MTGPTNSNARRQPGEASNQSNQQIYSTKKAHVAAVLRVRSMNRFEAEQICFDHCLNSTVAELRRDGFILSQDWETVQTRAGRPARVLRYRIIRGPKALPC